MFLLLATRDGLAIAEPRGDGWKVVRHVLNGRAINSVGARPGLILAGTDAGILRSDDRGESWHAANAGLDVGHVRWLALHPDDDQRAFAGTEPAALFVSDDEGGSWRECPEVTALREAHGWWLPYSPEAGCVRGFAFHGARGYAAVEVGGALRSDDGGSTWQLAPGSDGKPQFGQPVAGRVHPDVHSVVVHPSTPDLVLAPTGGGFYRSEDSGASWAAVYADCYVRAVWVNPADANHMVLGPSEGPSGKNGRIEVTHDGGLTWRPTSERWSANMVERFTATSDYLLATMAKGQVLAAPIAQLRWQPILTDLPPVNAIAAVGKL